MARSTYSGGDNNPASQYKYAAEGIAKEYKFRLVNEEAFQKRKNELITKTNKAALEQEIENARLIYQETAKSSAANDAEKQKALDRYNELRIQKELEIQQIEQQCSQEALQFATQCATKRYNNMTAQQQSYYMREQSNQAQLHLQELENLKAEYIAQEQYTTSIEEARELKEKLLQITFDIDSLEENLQFSIQEKNRLQNLLIAGQLTYLDASERERVIKEQISDEEEKQVKLREQQVELAAQGKSDSDPEMKKLQDALSESAEKIRNANEMLAKSNIEAYKTMAAQKVDSQLIEGLNKTAELKSTIEAQTVVLKGDAKKGKGADASTADKIRATNKDNRAKERESARLEEQEQAKQANEDFLPILKENFKQQASVGAQTAAAIKSGFKALEDLSKSIDQNIDAFYEYQGTINARLQGTNETFNDISKTIKKNVGFSGIVSQKEIVNNIKQLTDSGVAYNLEVRAFLASVSENIADTFSAFDSNLLRIIRIQQADTTAARLGMEASLTKLFNQYFSDSSYLTDAFDSVTESILDASAQMTRDQSMEFEYIVQKWLGALYSLGLSQDAVSTIAQGINYLGTGNVDALNNNDALRTLMAMSASNAGMDFGQILVDGLDPDGTNLLMKSMIQYLADIASNTSTNQVTKAVYAELFGVSTPDLNVFTNLSSSVDSLFASTQTYNESMNEVSNQLSQVASRLHISQIIDTAFENVQVETATNIGGNAATYGLWKTLNVIEGLTGGIQIPAFSVFGNMVDLDTTVTALAKTGIAGLSMMSSLLGGLFSGNLFGSLDLKSWGFDEYTSRGAAPTQIRSGMASGTSESSEMNMVGSSSSEDIKSTSMTDATDQANEDKEITNKDVKQNVDIYEQIRDALWESESITALSELKQIRQRMDKPFKAEMDAIHSLYRKVWWVQARILGQDQSFYTEQGPQGSEGDSTTSSGGEETVTVVNLTQDYVDKLQETLLGATYKVEVTNIDALSSGGSSGGTGELNTKVEETTNQLTEAIDKQISETEDVLTTLVTDQNKKDQAGEEVSVFEGDNTNTSNYNKSEDTTLVEGTDALSSLLSLLSLDRVFKVELDSLEGSTSSNILSQLVQSGDSNSSSITSIVDEIQNNSIIDSISQLHADVTTVKSTLGISEGNTDGGRVVVTGMSDEMKSYINNAIKSMIAQALSDQATQEANKENENDFATTLQKALSLMNVNVNVTNDFFNEFLQKNAFVN